MRNVRRALVAGALLATLTMAGPFTPSAQAGPAGTLSGIVTDAGSPVAGACVSVLNAGDAREIERPCTGPDGRYRVDGLGERTAVKIRVTAPGYVEAWAPDRSDARNATVYTLTTAPTVADIALRTVVGSLSGRITDPEGRGAATARVKLRTISQTVFGETLVDGTYRFANLPPDDYEVTIARDDLAVVTGLPVRVVGGQETTANFAFTTRLSQPARTGVVSGRITDGRGGPGVPGATVVLFSEPFTELATTTTDGTGRYRITEVPVFRPFRMRVAAPGYAETWAPDSPDFANGYERQVSDQLVLDVPLHRGAGTLRGRVLDPGGYPVRFARVSILVPGAGRETATFTRMDGTYEQVNLQPQRYTVSVTADGLGRQWVRGKDLAADADLVTVADGAVTTQDERYLPRGRLEVIVVDAVTGARVSTGCVSASAIGWDRTLCAGSSGVYAFADAPPGTVDFITVGQASDHLGTGLENVRVRSGQTSYLIARVRPAGTITTTVRRAADGTIPRVCASVVPTGIAAPWALGGATGTCNTDSQGMPIETLTIGPVAAGPVQLFLFGSGAHGAQWLGASGGTGDRRNAAVINVPVGATVPAPQVTMDPAGSISGVVRDKATGAPVPNAIVRPFGQVAGLETVCGNLPWYTGCTDANGRYRLDGLGPYAWPVEFSASGHASVWSGGATDRFHATYVPVRSGAVTALDATMGPEAVFTNFNRGRNPPQYWAVNAHHPVTGDIVGIAVYHAPTLGGLNTGPVILRYVDYTPNVPSCWYTGARSSRTPKVLNVTAGQTISGIAILPGSTCVVATGQGSPGFRAGSPIVVPDRPAVAPPYRRPPHVVRWLLHGMSR